MNNPATTASDPHFNLLDEPWIPVLWRDGSHERFGLRDALTRSHEIATIDDDLPTNQVGIFRSLMTVLVAALSNDARSKDNAFAIDGELWGTLIDAEGPKPWAKELNAYFDKHEAAFELFGANQAFFQDVGKLHKSKDAKLKGVAELRGDLPAGTAISHFTHSYDGSFGLDPAGCAAGLCAIPAFASSGGRGIFPSINGVPPTYAWPRARSLWQQLILALPLQKIAADDAPLWEGKPSTKSKTIGLLEGLTWQARFVGLKRDKDGLVRNILFEMGRKADAVNGGALAWQDPMACVGWTPSRPMGNQRVTSLFTQATFNLFPAHIVERANHPALLGVDFIGMANDGKAKNFGFTHLYLKADLLVNAHDEELNEDLTAAWEAIRQNTISNKDKLFAGEQWELERRVKHEFLRLCFDLTKIDDDAKQAEHLETWIKKLKRTTVAKIKHRRTPNRYDVSKVDNPTTYRAFQKVQGEGASKTTGELFVSELEEGGWSQGLVKRAFLDTDSPDRALAFDAINILHRQRLSQALKIDADERKEILEEVRELHSIPPQDPIPQELINETVEVKKLFSQRHVSWTVARLYAIHPSHRRSKENIGATLRAYLHSLVGDKNFGKLLREDPIALAFQRALVAESGDVAELLRPVFQALATSDRPAYVDFAKLYDDLSAWNTPNAGIAKSWQVALTSLSTQTDSALVSAQQE